MSDLYCAPVPKSKQKAAMTYPQKCFAKKAFSRFFLGYVLMYLATEVFAVGLVFGIKWILPMLPANISGPLVNFLNDYYITTFVLYAFMYFLAFPLILYPMVKRLPTWDKRCDGMPGGRIIIFFLILQFSNIILANVGVAVENVIAGLLGVTTEPVFSDIPLWVLAILSLLIAPIFEELIFRKVLMDRIGVYGERLAIIVSALSFGGFHGNFQQFFFTTVAGLVLALIYAKTKKIIYPIILHFINNAYGVLQQTVYEIESLSTEIHMGVTYADLILIGVAYTLFVTGLVFFIIALCKGWFCIKNSPDAIHITSSRARIKFFNIGVLAFTCYIIFNFMASLLPVDEWVALLKGIIG